MKDYKVGRWRFLILGVVIVVIFFVCRSLGFQRAGDFRLGVVTSEGLGMVAISSDRRMINVLKVDKEVEVWIPEGMGWYASDRVDKILKQEKVEDKATEIFFYNFGFIPNKVLFLARFDDWEKDGVLIVNMGFLRWTRYKYDRNRMLLSEDNLNKKLSDKEAFLDETMVTSFADSKVLDNDLRLTVINSANESGLAAFVARGLDRAGFTVMGIETDPEKKIDNCVLVFNSALKKSYIINQLGVVLPCKKEEVLNLDKSEAEIYLGEGFSKMLKYSNYVRTF